MAAILDRQTATAAEQCTTANRCAFDRVVCVVCQAHDSYNEMGHKFCAGFRDNLYVVTVTAQPCRAQIDISIARYPRFNVQGDNGPAYWPSSHLHIAGMLCSWGGWHQLWCSRANASADISTHAVRSRCHSTSVTEQSSFPGRSFVNHNSFRHRRH
jgi:hypothetical protein